MALLISKAVPDIFHTAQGTEFMAENITHFLERLGIKVSTSDKASPWQNGYLFLKGKIYFLNTFFKLTSFK